MHTLRGRVILLVNDNLREAQQILQFLRLRGASVLGPVPNVEYALEIIQTERSIDYALVERTLRGADTHAVAEALLRRQIPLVFLNGDSDPALPSQLRHIPCRTKPLVLPDLAEELLTLDAARFALPTAQVS